MFDDLIDDTEKQFDKQASKFQMAMRLYPALCERVFEFSKVGVSFESALKWQQLGLLKGIESPLSEETRLHFFDYCWLNVIKTLQEFNVSNECIAQFQEMLRTDWVNMGMNGTPDYIEFLRENSALEAERIDSIAAFVDPSFWQSKSYVSGLNPARTELASLLLDVLLKQDPVCLHLIKEGDIFRVNSMVLDAAVENPKFIDHLLGQPCLLIPFRNLLIKMLEMESGLDKLGKIGLLAAEEQKALKLWQEQEIESISVKLIKDKREFVLVGAMPIQKRMAKEKELQQIFIFNEYVEAYVITRQGERLQWSGKC